jgi:hypothetical protein
LLNVGVSPSPNHGVEKIVMDIDEYDERKKEQVIAENAPVVGENGIERCGKPFQS